MSSQVALNSYAQIEVDIALIIQPALNDYNDEANFGVPADIIGQPIKQSQQTLEIGANYQELYFLGSINNKVADDMDSQTDEKINELYYNFNFI